MSNLLKDKHALALLRAKLEREQERECWVCRKFGHLAYNYRTKKEEEKRGKPQNKFEILASRVMQSRERGQCIRRQEIEEEKKKIKCFRCWGVGHHK